jgi:hypothetical protein
VGEIDDLRAEVRRLSDRLEIIDLFYRFAAGMDGQDWALLGSVWSDDAVVDHTGTHWGKGLVEELQHGREEVMRVMKKGVSRHFVSHHVITNPRIKLDGDRARAVTYLTSVHLDDPEKPTTHEDHGAWYLAELVRTNEGWRIKYIKHISLWKTNMDPLGPVTKEEVEEYGTWLDGDRARP